MLKIIEKEGETSDLTDTAQYLQALDKATTLAHYSRGKKLADPAFRKVNEQNLVTDEYIQKLIDSHATSYSQDDESESTTHFVIADHGSDLLYCFQCCHIFPEKAWDPGNGYRLCQP